MTPLLAGLVTGLVLLGGPLVPAGGGCDSSLASAAICGSNDGSSVTITGDRETSGSPGAPASPTRRDGSGDSDDTSSSPEDTRPICSNLIRTDCRRGLIWRGWLGPSTSESPPITLSDIASFAPEAPLTRGDPSDVGVAGRPMNVVASASVHTREGSVLGTPVTVRFSPVTFDFHYGDGTTVTRSTGGRTWADLGQAPFTPTDTSHVYTERGTFDVSVTVHYMAEVLIGGEWTALDGELPVTGPVQSVRIYEAHTALVDRTCDEAPSAPGC